MSKKSTVNWKEITEAKAGTVWDCGGVKIVTLLTTDEAKPFALHWNGVQSCLVGEKWFDEVSRFTTIKVADKTADLMPTFTKKPELPRLTKFQLEPGKVYKNTFGVKFVKVGGDTLILKPENGQIVSQKLADTNNDKNFILHDGEF